mgnify:CR=1 FL=1
MTVYDYISLNGRSLMFWALEWFSMTNDAFYELYHFNFNPHNYPGLYEEARKIYFKDDKLC